MSACITCSTIERDFGREYEIAQSPVMLEIERRVRGADYGGTSWTTRAQAEHVARQLGLAPGLQLLEVGGGAGWPGLFLSTGSGCEVVISDLPLQGLRIAQERAARDGLAARCSIVAADGTSLPFRDRSFDRVHHADVLCCMVPKREMLRECRRVARSGALMAFSVISLADAPSDEEGARLLQLSGPPYPDAGADYAVLLQESGWDVLERIDVTAEFVRCMDVQLDETRARCDVLLALLGEQDLAERVQRRECTRAAVERGLLRRESFVATIHPTGPAARASGVRGTS